MHIDFSIIEKSLKCGKKPNPNQTKSNAYCNYVFSYIIYDYYLSVVKKLGYISQNILILLIISKAIQKITWTKPFFQLNRFVSFLILAF